MFGGFKKNKQTAKLSKSTISYLNKVDTEYMRAFAVKTTKDLQTYLEPDCVIKVSRSIFARGSRYFGAAKFRNTTWSILDEKDGIQVLRKDVVFDEVKICKNLNLSVAENYSEQWYMRTVDNIIVDIQPIAV